MLGESGYTMEGDVRVAVQVFDNQDILNELNIDSMAILDADQVGFVHYYL